MAEFKTEEQVNYGWGLSLNMTGKAPAVTKRIFTTYDNALAYVNDIDDSAIPGLKLSVFNDPDDTKNGIYFVKATAHSAGVANGGVLQMIGKDPQLITEDDINSLFQ